MTNSGSIAQYYQFAEPGTYYIYLETPFDKFVLQVKVTKSLITSAAVKFSLSA